MRFRWRIQLLLLVISLPPMVLVASFYHVGTTDLGNELAAHSQEVLVDDAYRLLHRIVDDYGRLLSRNQQTLELAVDMQAMEVERRLARPPTSNEALFITGSTVKLKAFRQGLGASGRHFRVTADGTTQPIPVNFDNQVFHLAPDAERDRATADMRRLADMTDAYRSLHAKIPLLAMWQYTGLESGVISNYPGVESFPRDFDPRKRLWYRSAKRAGRLIWGEPYVDALSGDILLTLSRPVHGPDGSFAGVTSIDFPFGAVLGEVKLPVDWAKNARVMSVSSVESAGADLHLKIVAQKSYRALRLPWQAPVKIDFLQADDPQALASLVADAEAGRSGVRRMGYDGIDSFWAYGAMGPGRAFPVIIIPYDFIVAQANETRARVIETTLKALHLTAAILVVVVVVVTALAFWGSRSVSRPIRHLAEAAIDLANGDFETRVDLRTGGELKMLGDVFNAMGPRLKERERMQAALVLAKEVQQYLLPAVPPESRWLEIVVSCSFCEELGGDYYDFVDLQEVLPGRLGIAVGDVSGHGVGAALLMATLRGGLHSLVEEHHEDLGGMMRLLNRNFFASSGLEKFMTLFYGVLDEAEGTFRWVSAGHGPCYWMQRESGQISELETTGIPLGILDKVEYPPAAPIRLSSGDALIIGTDGLWEAQNAAGEMFGTARLLRQLESCWDRSAADLQASVLAAQREFCGALPQADDITLMVVKVR